MSPDPHAELEQLRRAYAECQERLAEAEQTLAAIQRGEVDALVIDGPAGQQIFSLTGADRPYRTLVEQMSEGAVTLDAGGFIRYCNQAFADLVGWPLEGILGAHIERYILDADRAAFQALLRESRSDNTHAELTLHTAEGSALPVYMSMARISDDGQEATCLVAMDLSERRRAEAISSSAQLVQSLIKAAPIGVAVVDRDLRYVLANPVYRDLARGQLLPGRRIEEVFEPDIACLIAPLVMQVLKTGEHVPARECSVAGGEGSWWNLSLVPLREGDHAVSSVLILTEDITAQKRAAARAIEELQRNLLERERWEAQLQASEERLQIGLTAAHAGTFEWNTETGDQVWTDGIYQLLGLPPGQEPPSEHLWRRHVHPEDVDRVKLASQHAIRSGERYMADYRLNGADGVTRWVQGQGLVVNRPGKAPRMIGAIVDITERKRIEEVLRASQQALMEADRAKDAFLATLAHELRNPLSPIMTSAQLLASPTLNADQLRRAQAIIQRQVGNMALMLDDLLDIARITQGKLRLKRKPVEFTRVVDTAVEAARPLIDAKHHRLVVSLPADPVWLEVDPLRVSQIISNLLTNAAKYSDGGTKIELSGTVVAGSLCITVRDEGVGIPPAALDRIFEMFSQVDTTSPRSDGGLGIGLALVKGLVELHGGAVEAKSEGLGTGSQFTVRLPLKPVTAPALKPVVTDGAPTVGLRILIADDNKDAAESLGMLLEMNGHETRVAHNGRAALEVAHSFRPNVALLDLGMPDMNGYELARQLRRESWGTGIRMCALTGWGQDRDRQRSKEAGFDYHLTKPIDPNALGALLEDHAPGG